MTEKLHSYDAVKARVDASYTPKQWNRYRLAEQDAQLQIELAELIYAMRTKAGMSQRDLARKLDVKQPFIAALETGGRLPKLTTLQRIATATNHSIHLKVEPTP
ncbi:MAG: helix-turn-helix transcriptional regulator [Actinomycetaceae bacterium]|nr:helix-turn-helix transcriptional regulator [Actinomycetaceae bacterium]